MSIVAVNKKCMKNIVYNISYSRAIIKYFWLFTDNDKTKIIVVIHTRLTGYAVSKI